ncbi:MAG: class I SAM-dependent methyltransferase, partial [Brachymonas sp.]|nr:class I SAM-dependent methyltransferase [Brachymonas sp.]
MTWPLRPADNSCTCKVCGGAAAQFGACDVNQGGPPGAAPRPALGQEISYFRCESCGLIFTNQLDDWGRHDFAAYIYNEGYVEVDPDYVRDRPMANAQMLLNLLRTLPISHQPPLRLLDFGAGSGLLAQQLIAQGIEASSHDPYGLASALDLNNLPKHSYDVVCAFEVLEHSADQLDTLAQLKSQLKPGGLAVISTLLQPYDIAQQRCNWWYCAPRNGHITLFSASALTHALNITGASSARS